AFMSYRSVAASPAGGAGARARPTCTRVGRLWWIREPPRSGAGSAGRRGAPAGTPRAGRGGSPRAAPPPRHAHRAPGDGARGPGSSAGAQVRPPSGLASTAATASSPAQATPKTRLVPSPRAAPGCGRRISDLTDIGPRTTVSGPPGPARRIVYLTDWK